MNHLVLEPPQVLLLRFVSQMFSCWKFNTSAQYLALNSLLLIVISGANLRFSADTANSLEVR